MRKKTTKKKSGEDTSDTFSIMKRLDSTILSELINTLKFRSTLPEKRLCKSFLLTVIFILLRFAKDSIEKMEKQIKYLC